MATNRVAAKPAAPVFALSAGEASGDYLGAQCAAAIYNRYPNATIYGIGGTQMRAQGVDIVAAYDALAVMGYWQVLTQLPAILKTRAALTQKMRAHPPDVFVGIDAPDFNLNIARRVRAGGKCAVQYVAPGAWMWRRSRCVRIRESVNMLWCLLPFEPAFFARENIPAQFVGHPLALQTAASAAGSKKAAARQAVRAQLGIAPNQQVIALFPGSRDFELAQHLPLFAKAMKQLQQPHRRFLAAVHQPAIAERVQNALPAVTLANIDDVLAAADVAIAKSGTTTLQVAMAQVPMLMVYRLSRIAFNLVRWRQIHHPYFSLPNILARRFVVPELVQDDATPTAIASEAERLLADSSARQKMLDAFAKIRAALTEDAMPLATAVQQLEIRS